MEKLKPLRRITEPDPRHQPWTVLDPEDPKRPLDVADQHAEMEALELPATVPETVRSAFAVTRTLWLYGWFYWPFYTLSGFHAYATVEMGLHLRCEEEGAYEEIGLKRKNAGLKRLLQVALERRWITDDAFQRFRFWRERAEEQDDENFAWRKPAEVKADIPRDQHYAYLIRESASFLRNSWAHPDHHSHWDFGHSREILQVAHDILAALFPLNHREG